MSRLRAAVIEWIDDLRSFWGRLVADRVPRLFLLLILVVLGGGITILAVEGGHNPGFRTLEDGLWWALVTLTTVGYGDKVPVTTAGHLVATAVVILGMGTVGLTTAKIASMLVEQKIREGRGLSDASHLEGHLVLLGWKADMHLLVKEVLGVNSAVTSRELVLVNNADRVQNEELRNRYPGVVYLRGDIVDTLALQRANLSKASQIMILADVSEPRSDQEIDARTVMTAMTVERLAPLVYTCAEVLDSKYAEHLRLARCEEVVLSREYSRFLLVSASVSHGVSNALHDLMNVSNRSGIATTAIPETLVERSYAELFRHFKGTGDLLLGLLVDTGRAAAIKQQALREAQKTASVDSLIENLKRVKHLEVNRPVLNPPDDYRVPAGALAIVIRSQADA